MLICVLRHMNDAMETQPVTYSCREIQRSWWKKISIHKPGMDVVTISCLLMVLMHGFVSLNGGVIKHEELYVNWLGLTVDGIFAGKFWQLLTYAFLHGSWFHLLTNVLMIWLIGGRVLSIFDQKMVAKCLLLGTVVGGLFFVGFDYLSSDGSFLVGSSGAAFALFILMACLSPHAKLFPIPVRAKNMALGVITASFVLSLISLGTIQGLPLLSSMYSMFEQHGLGSIFKVAHSCHLGGGLAGYWLSTRLLGKMITLDDLKRSRID